MGCRNRWQKLSIANDSICSVLRHRGTDSEFGMHEKKNVFFIFNVRFGIRFHGFAFKEKQNRQPPIEPQNETTEIGIDSVVPFFFRRTLPELVPIPLFIDEIFLARKTPLPIANQSREPLAFRLFSSCFVHFLFSSLHVMCSRLDAQIPSSVRA